MAVKSGSELTLELGPIIAFAAERHSRASREGEQPLPYVTHPIEVLANLRYVGEVTDSEMLAAAILHDTVEEAVCSLAEIEQRYGLRVRSLVAELTRAEPTPAQTSGLKKSEIRDLRAKLLLEETRAMSPDAQVIKLADRLANIRDSRRTKSKVAFERYVQYTKAMLDAVPRNLNRRLWDAIAEECKE